MNKLPTKISPCPIIEATVELKFSSTLPKGAIFGIIYNTLKDTFGTVEKLPTAMLPNEIIENDPNLKYKALYKLTDGHFNVQVGNDVISIHSPNNYVRWETFLQKIIPFFDKINHAEIVDKTESLVLRYLNFFEIDIYKNINLHVQMLDKPYESNNLVVRTESWEGLFIKILQIANNVTVTNALGQKQGSLLDIACVLHNPDNLFSNIKEIISQAHQIEKELFFGLLKREFLETLKPEYKNE
jgi:uncharacterized protein (TIGR04255 family)